MNIATRAHGFELSVHYWTIQPWTSPLNQLGEVLGPRANRCWGARCVLLRVRFRLLRDTLYTLFCFRATKSCMINKDYQSKSVPKIHETQNLGVACEFVHNESPDASSFCGLTT